MRDLRGRGRGVPGQPVTVLRDQAPAEQLAAITRRAEFARLERPPGEPGRLAVDSSRALSVRTWPAKRLIPVVAVADIDRSAYATRLNAR